MFDPRFRCPSTCVIAGPSQSGKTSLVVNILSNNDNMFQNPKCIQKIIWYYKEWQPLYDKLNMNINFTNKMPTIDNIKENVQEYSKKGGSIIVLDDFMQTLTPDIGVLFTTLSHHLNINVFLLTQNLFGRNPIYRDISLNSTYIILFKNPRDSSQISNFAKQYAPGKAHIIKLIYKKATTNPHSHLLFDTHQNTPDNLRIRSNILARNEPINVWSLQYSI
jgi:hypothetical protein